MNEPTIEYKEKIYLDKNRAVTGKRVIILNSNQYKSQLREIFEVQGCEVIEDKLVSSV